MRRAALAAGGNVEAGTPESGMIAACRLRDARAGCGMRIAFRDSDQVRPSRGSSAIPTPVSSRSPGGQKNGLRDLRPGAARMVRPQAAPGPGSGLRRPADLPRRRSPARGLSALRHGEAGAPRLPGRHALLHQALRLLRGPALSGLPDPGCGQGAATRGRPTGRFLPAAEHDDRTRNATSARGVGAHLRRAARYPCSRPDAP